MTRKPGEPIYQRRHMVALALVIVLPLVLLQLYKLYVGPVGFGTQLFIGVIMSIAGGIALYRAFNASARNQP